MGPTRPARRGDGPQAVTGPAVTLKGRAAIDGAHLFGPLALEMVAGGWTCLLGPSGVGKSTLLRLIAGLPTGAALDGDIAAGDGRPLHGRTTYMSQDDMLLPWLDVTGNVALGARLRGARPDLDRARSLIDRVGLGEHARRRPGRLSGGQRQRVALARTLMEERPVVLLDEPFSALDARTRAEMQDLAAATLAGASVLLVTHEPSEAARLGHRIYLMAQSGLSTAEPPAAPPVRAVDAPDVLRFQADLLGRLREPA